MQVEVDAASEGPSGDSKIIPDAFLRYKTAECSHNPAFYNCLFQLLWSIHVCHEIKSFLIFFSTDFSLLVHAFFVYS